MPRATDPVTGAGQTPSGGALDQIDAALTLGNEGKNVGDQISGQGYRGAGIQGMAAAGGGSIFNEPILVVNQKAKLIELNNQYSVYDQNGQQIAAVAQVGQSVWKKLLRLFGSLDQFFTHTLEVTGPGGQVQMRIVRPRKFFKSKVIVEDPNGNEVGRIVQKNMIGKISFSLQVQRHRARSHQGRELASLEFPNRRVRWHRGRPDHQDLRGHRQDDVHHC